MSTATAVPDHIVSQDDLRRPVRRDHLSAEHLASPPVGDRPGIRWWWQSPVAPAELTEELRAIAAAGFGEVEIAFSPGFWADDAQRAALRAVLAEAEAVGVTVAMTLGAAWPLQTPNTTRGTEYAAQEVQYGVAWVEADGTPVTLPVPRPFDDPDGERASALLAVVAARVLERGTEPRIVPSGNPWGKPTKIIDPERSTVLEEGSLAVLTELVSGGGTGTGEPARPEGDGRRQPADAVGPTLTWEPGEGTWAVTAFWTRDAEQGVTSFLDARSARAALDYLDEHQIGDAVDGTTLAGSPVTELFEDSLELNADCLFWSPDLLERFEAGYGYDLTPYLPLLLSHGACRYWVPQDPVTPDFTVPSGLGARVRADYDRLITDLYVSDHLRLIQDWAVDHGARHKAQAAYGQNLEPVRSFRELVRCGGRAEAESLNSGDRVPVRMDHPNWRFALDWQRSVVGGAHQGGAVRVSTELGAQMDACYNFSLAAYRQMLDKEWAVGITRPYVHGFATQAPDAPWPTQGRFGTVVAESWNHRHFPQWEHWAGLTAYWARGTAVLETGAPRSDVAVYRDGFLTTAARGNEAADAEAPDRLIDAEPLERHGYLVQVIDPVGLAEDGVVGQEGGGSGTGSARTGRVGTRADGVAGAGADAAPSAGSGAQADGVAGAGRTVLFPDGPAYRALVIGQERVTADAARAVEAAARAGLAIVVVGEVPVGDTGWGGTDRDAEVRAAFAAALACPSVVRVDDWADVPGALADLGVRPRAGWEGPVLLSQVRDTADGRLVLVYNPGAQPVGVRLDLEGEGTVEVLDLDAGTVTPVQASSRAVPGGGGTGSPAGVGAALAAGASASAGASGATAPVAAGVGRTGVEVSLAGLGLVVLRLVPEDPAEGAVPAGPAGADDLVLTGPVRVEGAWTGAGAVALASSLRPVGAPGAGAEALGRADSTDAVGPVPGARELALEGWDLTVVSEEPGGPRRVELPGQGPADWREVVGLEQVSGTGTYCARVADDVPAEALADAVLVLGDLGGSAVVRVGGRGSGGAAGPGGAGGTEGTGGAGGTEGTGGAAGPGGAGGTEGTGGAGGTEGTGGSAGSGGATHRRELGPVLRPDSVLELGDALVHDRVIEIEVRTTLRNATLAADAYMTGPWAVEHPSAPHGLIGPVRLFTRQ